MAEIVDQIVLDDSEYLKALKRIDKNIDKIAGSGQKSFNQVDKGAKTSALGFGAVAGAATVLIDKLVQLGETAARALGQVVAGGVSANASLEQAERTFGAAFGDPALGEATISFLQRVSDELNINQALAIQFGQTILPKTDDLDTFTELLRLTDIQADATGKSVGELEFSIREALSGDFISIRDQFDLSKENINQIKELTPELGRAKAVATVVAEEFEKLGKVNITGTLQTDTKALQAEFADLQTQLGVPVFDELKEQVTGLGEIFDERGEEFGILAEQVGAILAEALEFGGDALQDFLQNLDTDQIGKFLLDLQNVVEAGKLFIEVALGWTRSVGEFFIAINPVQIALEALDIDLQALFEQVGGGSGVFLGLIELLAMSRAGFAGLTAIAQQATQALILSGQAVQAAIQGNIGQAIQLSEAAEEAFSGIIDAGREANQQSLAEFRERLAETNQAIEENNQAQEERTNRQEESNEAAEETINNLLQQAAAEEQAAKDAAKLAEALDTVNEKLGKLETDKARSEADALIDKLRDLRDEEIKTSQAREKAQRSFARKVEELEIDAANERAEEAAKIEKESAEERADIERSFRQEIEDIQRESNLRLQDAERSRDAVAFLQALQSQEERVDQAKTERERRLEEAEIEKQQRQAQLGEVETDLQERIDKEKRALEAQLEEISISSQQRQEKRELDFQQELTDIEVQNARKLQDLQRQLADEIQVIEEGTGEQVNLFTDAEKLKTLALEQEAARRMEILEEELSFAIEQTKRLQEVQSAGAGAGLGSNPSLLTFQRGGVVPGSPGTPVPIIAHAGETIIPANPQMTTPGLGPQMSTINNINNSRSASLGGMIDPGSLDSLLAAKVQNILVGLLGQI